MKTFVFAVIAALCGFFLAPQEAHAARAQGPWYYSDCQTGADTNCVAGTDATGATACQLAAPCRTTSNMRTNFNNSAVAGDTFVFARGGVFTNVNHDLHNAAGTWASPIVLDSYLPSWCTSTCPATYPQAILQQFNTDFASLWFTSGCGYTVQNLNLQGSGNIDAPGIFTAAIAGCTKILNNTISGFNIGIQIGQASTLIQIMGNNIKNNTQQGALVAGNRMKICYNTFDNNGYSLTNGHGHNLYQEGFAGFNNEICWNVSTNNSKGPDGTIPGTTCTSTHFVLHGNHNGTVYEGNTIKEATSAIGDGCWGIAADDSAIPEAEAFRALILRNNLLINVTVGIGCNACVAPVFENNVIVYEGTGTFFAILAPDKPLASTGPSTQSTGMIARNNSIYVSGCSSDCIGIHMGFIGSGQTAGSNLVVTNNLLYFASGANAAHQCFNMGISTLSNFTAMNNNLCYHAGGNGRWSATYANLAAAQAASFDTNGSASNPTLTTTPSTANNGQFDVQTGSPAINNGNTTYKARLGYRGCKVTGARDIGAYDFGCIP